MLTKMKLALYWKLKAIRVKSDGKGHLISIVIEVHTHIFFFFAGEYFLDIIELEDIITSLTNKYLSAKTLLGGDFNMVWSHQDHQQPYSLL